MLVPIELHSLTMRVGYLSPDLAIGWRIGKYVEVFFDGLEEVSIAARIDTDAVFALSHLTRQHGYPGRIIVPKAARPWDFLFYHAVTGTLLKFVLVRQQTRLPEEIEELEHHLSPDNPEVAGIYQAGLDLLVKSLLSRPLTSFCHLSQFRCRRLLAKADAGQLIRCRRCGLSTSVRQAWDIEGEVCCLSCSGLEPIWFTYH